MAMPTTARSFLPRLLLMYSLAIVFKIAAQNALQA